MMRPDYHTVRRELSEDAAHRLLARAVELDASRSYEFSIAQLRDVAREAGISATAFEDALAEIPDAARASQLRSEVVTSSTPSVLARTIRNGLRFVLGGPAPTSPRGWLRAFLTNVLPLVGVKIAISIGVAIGLRAGLPTPAMFALELAITFLFFAVALRTRGRLATVLLGSFAAAQFGGYLILTLYRDYDVRIGTPPGWMALTVSGIAGVLCGALVVRFTRDGITGTGGAAGARADAMQDLVMFVRALLPPRRRTRLPCPMQPAPHSSRCDGAHMRFHPSLQAVV